MIVEDDKLKKEDNTEERNIQNQSEEIKDIRESFNFYFCAFKGCKKKYTRVSRLKIHVRTHVSYTLINDRLERNLINAMNVGNRLMRRGTIRLISEYILAKSLIFARSKGVSYHLNRKGI